jgi:hypothetical protein
LTTSDNKITKTTVSLPSSIVAKVARVFLSSQPDRLLVRADDDSLTLLTATADTFSTVWQREEALARISHVQFLDLPSADTEIVKDSSVTFTHRMKVQWNHLMVRSM